MKNKGFTLIEVIIACGILSLFIGGVLTLYSSGSRMSNSTMWLQNTTNKLRNATRQINESIRKGSYPTKIEFAKNIIQSTDSCFDVQYYEGKLTSEKTSSGKEFLKVTESKPEKLGGDDDPNVEGIPGELKFHIFTLSQNGDLTYSRYIEEGVKGITSGFSRNKIPSDKSKKEYQAVLVKDVEYVNCEKKEDRDDSPIEITIKCVMSNKKTSRSETAVGVPNVKVAVLK